jgi:hypothetical protein
MVYANEEFKDQKNIRLKDQFDNITYKQVLH